MGNATKLPRTRRLTVIAQDPSITYKRGPRAGQIVTSNLRIPAESLAPGPCGYRLHCIDYDATTDTYYETGIAEDADDYCEPANGSDFAAYNQRLLTEPSFHCQNVYGLMMQTLARFEFALGRRLAWGFGAGHQLKVAPHAFTEANAYYSEEDQALLFGYFPSSLEEGDTIFTCLSHDVVVHETTHALVDGVRTRFTDPSSADQAAFHEGFADVVALLSIFALPTIPEVVIDNNFDPGNNLISVGAITPEALRDSIGGLADQVGAEISGVRGDPLRQSMKLVPGPDYLKQAEFLEPHRRGEILVAAVMNAFLTMWSERLQHLGEKQNGMLDRSKVVEEGADLAAVLLTSAIRALDYTPPVHLSFNDYLTALLTADQEVRPGTDDRYHLRENVKKSFEAYFIEPAEDSDANGMWKPPTDGLDDMRYERTHFEPMQRDADEVFHFIWENRDKDHLKLDAQAYTRVESVRPCIRVGEDGFTLRETVAEYVQILKVHAGELAELKLKKPEGMPDEKELYLYGGGTLIFDEYGRLKYHVFNPVCGSKQNERLDYLYRAGFFDGKSLRTRFSSLHRSRAMPQIAPLEEGW
jgi:hypothetical protein